MSASQRDVVHADRQSQCVYTQIPLKSWITSTQVSIVGVKRQVLSRGNIVRRRLPHQCFKADARHHDMQWSSNPRLHIDFECNFNTQNKWPKYETMNAYGTTHCIAYLLEKTRTNNNFFFFTDESESAAAAIYLLCAECNVMRCRETAEHGTAQWVLVRYSDDNYYYY